jgi:hypothetical protein
MNPSFPENIFVTGGALENRRADFRIFPANSSRWLSRTRRRPGRVATQIVAHIFERVRAREKALQPGV